MPTKFHAHKLSTHTESLRTSGKSLSLISCRTRQSNFPVSVLTFSWTVKNRLPIKSLNTWLESKPLKAPVLLWVLKFRDQAKSNELLKGLIGPRLLTAVFSAIDYEALQNSSTGNTFWLRFFRKTRALPDILLKDL